MEVPAAFLVGSVEVSQVTVPSVLDAPGKASPTLSVRVLPTESVRVLELEVALPSIVAIVPSSLSVTTVFSPLADVIV